MYTLDANGSCWTTPRFADLDGNPVKRDKYKYPYSYDPYVTFKGEYSTKDSAVYSDRLMLWNFANSKNVAKRFLETRGNILIGEALRVSKLFLACTSTRAWNLLQLCRDAM